MRYAVKPWLVVVVGCNPLLDLGGYAYVDPPSSGGGGASSDGGAGGGGQGGAAAAGGSGGQGCLETGDPDLLAYYPLDETSGTVARDCSGNGHDGTVISVIPSGSWVAGRFDGGFAANGTSGCIDLGAPASLMVETGPFTAAAWARASSFATAGGLGRYILGRTAEPEISGWRVGSADTTRWASKFRDTILGSVEVLGPDGEAADSWRHVVVVFDGGTARLYVDGSVIATAAYNAIMPDGDATLRIGCRNDDDFYFDGTLDEVRIYARAFDDDEVGALAAVGR